MADLIVRIRAEAGNTKRIVDEVNESLRRVGISAREASATASSAFAGLDGSAKNIAESFKALNIRSQADIVGDIGRIETAFGTLRTSGTLTNAELTRATAAYQAELARLQSELTGVGRAATQTGEAFTGITGSIRGAASAAAAFFGLSVGAETARGILAQAEAYQTLTSRLRLVADNSREFARSQSLVFEIAQRTRQPLNEVADLYGRVETALDGLGGSQAQAAQAVEAIGLAFQISGGSAQSAAAAIQQLTQGLQSGVLRGEEFNSVAEQAPAILQALAAGLGEPVSSLRQLADAGQLTTDKVLPALISQLGSLREQSAQLPTTIGQAFTLLNNQIERIVGTLDRSLGITQSLANSIQSFGSNLASPDTGLFRFTEGVVIATTAITEFVRVGQGETRPPLLEQIEASRRGFDELRQSAGLSAASARDLLGGLDDLQAEFLGAAGTAAQAAERQAQAIADGQLKAQEALKTTKDRLQEITDVLDEQLQRNLGAVDRTQQVRQTDSRTSTPSESRQERAVTQSLVDATKERLQIIQDYASQRLSIIQQTIDSEKTRTGAGQQTLKEIERASIEERKSLFKELESAYTQTINKLISEQQRQRDAARAIQEEINQLPQSQADAVAASRRQVASPQQRESLDAQQAQNDLGRLREASANRELRSQEELNDLFQRAVRSNDQLFQSRLANARELESEAQRNSAASGAQFENEQRINEIYELRKQILEGQRDAFQQNADALAQQTQSVQQQLQTVQAEIAKIDEKLAAQRELKIAIDPTALQTVRDVIAELVKPETKTITVVTQDGGGETNNSPPALARGGLIRGPGTPTSDSILAMLSDGEFVVRAAAVRRYGLSFFERLNAMALPGFAAGGLARRVQVPAISPALRSLNTAQGSQINLTLPGGQTFQVSAAPDVASRLVREVQRSALKRGNRQ